MNGRTSRKAITVEPRIGRDLTPGGRRRGILEAYNVHEEA